MASTQNPILLFDFDGTICDSHDSSLRIVNQLSDEFGFRKITSHELKEFKNQPLREVLSNLGISLTKLPKMAGRAKYLFHNDISSLKPVSGVSEVLSYLKSCEYHLGILSSNSKKNVEKFLLLHDLTQFDFVYGDSSIFGKAVSLKRLLKEQKIKNPRVYYIGDETRDVEAAKKAKIQSIAVTWGYNSKEILEKSQPTYLVQTPQELVKIFHP